MDDSGDALYTQAEQDMSHVTAWTNPNFYLKIAMQMRWRTRGNSSSSQAILE